MLAGFTTRVLRSADAFAGNLAHHVGDDPENARASRSRLEDETGPLSWMRQVHGTTIVEAGDTREADGMLIRPGQGGAVMVADCVPLLMYGEAEDGERLGAVVHVGRAGLLAGIARAAVDRFDEAGISAVSAVVGPSICGACYEVGPELAQQSERLLPGSSCTTRWGTPGIDIPGSLARQLTDRGVDVDRWDVCTMEDERFFSHRRQRGRAGRFAGVLVLNHDTPPRLDSADL